MQHMAIPFREDASAAPRRPRRGRTARKFAAASFAFVASASAWSAAAQGLLQQQAFDRDATLRELSRVEDDLQNAAKAARMELERVRRDDGSGNRAAAAIQPRVVNGTLTAAFPTTAALLRGGDPWTARSHCTATLIGCSTVLTAAHCVADDPRPENYNVFLTHAGAFRVAAITPHPAYDPSTYRADLAVVRLAEPVSGVIPTALNPVSPVGDGTVGTIAGFGRTGGYRQDYGLKRTGTVRTAACQGRFAGGEFVCWNFQAPVGVPGQDSNTCNADSGGPLFVNRAGSSVLAGVVSGGSLRTCLAGDHSYNVDVGIHRDWITQVVGADLNAQSCGPGLPMVGDDATDILGAAGRFGLADTSQVQRFVVPDGTRLLRVALNGHDDGQANFDLVLRAGSDIPQDGTSDCRRTESGQYAFCEVAAPRAGEWTVLVRRVAGAGEFVITATLFR